MSDKTFVVCFAVADLSRFYVWNNDKAVVFKWIIGMDLDIKFIWIHDKADRKCDCRTGVYCILDVVVVLYRGERSEEQHKKKQRVLQMMVRL